MNSTESAAGRLERLIELYSKSMMNAAYSILGCRQDAEDAVQDTFVKLFAGNYSFKDAHHEKAWLLRVTINNALGRLRLARRLAPFDDLPDTAAPLDDNQRAVAAAVHSLDPKYRVVTHLHFYEGYTIREIARILKIPESTAGTRLQRAKARLRELLNEEVN